MNSTCTHLRIAAQGFGRFQETFLEELYADIATHLEEIHRTELAKPTHSTANVAGLVVHDSEVLAPEPIRQGGLLRKEKDKQHPFRPNKSKDAPEGRTSLLGLDRLADEKRAQAQMQFNEPRKRRRLEEDQNGEAGFKGAASYHKIVISLS